MSSKIEPIHARFCLQTYNPPKTSANARFQSGWGWVISCSGCRWLEKATTTNGGQRNPSTAETEHAGSIFGVWGVGVVAASESPQPLKMSVNTRFQGLWGCLRWPEETHNEHVCAFSGVMGKGRRRRPEKAHNECEHSFSGVVELLVARGNPQPPKTSMSAQSWGLWGQLVGGAAQKDHHRRKCSIWRWLMGGSSDSGQRSPQPPKTNANARFWQLWGRFMGEVIGGGSNNGQRKPRIA